MISLRMTDKIRDKQGRVIGCIAVDMDNNKYSIPKSDFLKYNFVNVKITQDLKIKSISNKSTIQPKYTGDNGEVITLYHGSHKGLEGAIRSDTSRITCDFGLGFYTGDRIEQAKTIIANDHAGVFYTLKVRIDNLKVYRFTNSTECALYVGVHREKINRRSYKKLDNFVKYIDAHDIIIGPIADDKMNKTYNEFLNNLITDRALVECISKIKLGNQYVFKNDKACKNIKIVASCKLSKSEKGTLNNAWNNTLKNMNSIVKNVKAKFVREGLYMNELLKHWR